MVMIQDYQQLPVNQFLVLCFFVRTFIQDIKLERKMAVVGYVELGSNMVP